MISLSWRKAGSIVSTTGKVLKNESCPLVVVVPAMHALLAALKSYHVQPDASGEALLEFSLLRWARCPDLPPLCRPLLARAVHSITAGWEPQCHTLLQLQKRLAKELAEESAKQEEGGGSRVLGLAACVAPVLLRSLQNPTAGPGVGSRLRASDTSCQAPSSIPDLVQVLNAFSIAVSRGEWMAASGVKELCGHTNRSINTLIQQICPGSRNTSGRESHALSESNRDARLHQPPGEETTEGKEDAAHNTRSSVKMAAVELAVVDRTLRTDLAMALSALDIHDQNSKSSETTRDDPGRVSLKITLLPSSEQGGCMEPTQIESSFTGASLRPGREGECSEELWTVLLAGIDYVQAALGREDIALHSDVAIAAVSALSSWLVQLSSQPEESPTGSALKYPVPIVDKLALLADVQGGTLSTLRAVTDPAVIQPVARLYVHLLTHVEPVVEGMLQEMTGKESVPTAVLQFDVNVLYAAIKAGIPRSRSRAVWNALKECIILSAGSNQSTNESLSSGTQKAVVLKALSAAQAIVAQQLADSSFTDAEKQVLVSEAISLVSTIVEFEEKDAMFMALEIPAFQWAEKLAPLLLDVELDSLHALLEIAVRKAACGSPRSLSAGVQEAALRVCVAAVSLPRVSVWLVGPGCETTKRVFSAAVKALHSPVETVTSSGVALLQACAIPAVFVAMQSGENEPGSVSFVRSCVDDDLMKKALGAALQPRCRDFSRNQLAQVLDFITGRSSSGSNSNSSARVAVLAGNAIAQNEEKKDAADSMASSWLPQLAGSLSPVEGCTDNSYAGPWCSLE